MKQESNNLCLLKGEHGLLSFGSVNTFVAEWISRFWHSFPKGYYDVELFVADNTPFEGEVLRNMKREMLRQLEMTEPEASLDPSDPLTVKQLHRLCDVMCRVTTRQEVDRLRFEQVYRLTYPPHPRGGIVPVEEMRICQNCRYDSPLECLLPGNVLVGRGPASSCSNFEE